MPFIECHITVGLSEPRKPPIEETIMIEPDLRATICGNTIWISQ